MIELAADVQVGVEVRNTMRTFGGEMGMTQCGEFHDKLSTWGAEHLFQYLESLVVVDLLFNSGYI